jgi:hypothetical protein
VNHPWRLLLGNEVVGESREFFSGRGSGGRASLIDWDRWSRGFANWVPARLTGLSIGVDCPDLRLIFQSGHVLEAMSEPGHAANWSLNHHQGSEIINCKALEKISWGDMMPPPRSGA